MLTIEEVLSKRNQREAFRHFQNKKNGKGEDGVFLADLKEYWDLNKELIIQSILDQTYKPGIVTNVTVVNHKAKRRVISKLNVVDRFITRLLSQKLNKLYQWRFYDKSFAFQIDKGIQDAVKKSKEYLEEGKRIKVEIDLKDFFDEISLERMMSLLERDIRDSRLLSLISSYLYCRVSNDGEIEEKRKGLVQGCSLSPILSNLYLHDLDEYMEIQGYSWIRFADDISIFCKTKEEGESIFKDVSGFLTIRCLLPINEQKSGLFDGVQRRLLGYSFEEENGKIVAKKHIYKRTKEFNNWHTSVIQKRDGDYHLIQQGVLTKQDYSLLFENENEKHTIPVEVLDQLNVYNGVIVTDKVLQTCSEKGIRICFMNKYAEAIGYYVPSKYKSDCIVKQCALYLDSTKRLSVAKSMELATIHNLRANIRYHIKHGKNLKEQELKLTKLMDEIKRKNKIESLMLIEARARELYYGCFNSFYSSKDFLFTKRTRRPPKDSINALMSFLNTLLYNTILRVIWKYSLDPKIGVIHSPLRRSFSLHLDLADIFKPIIVDRVMFSLINRNQLNKSHFQYEEEKEGVYLNIEGKRIVIEAFKKKLNSTITIKNYSYTYEKLLEREVKHYQKMIMDDQKYKPYKYF